MPSCTSNILSPAAVHQKKPADGTETRNNKQVKSKCERFSLLSSVKRKGVQIVAGSSNDMNGETEITDKPAMTLEVNPPGKRKKSEEGAAAGGGGSGGGGVREDDVEVVGSAGAVVLPHNRFSCPEV